VLLALAVGVVLVCAFVAGGALELWVEIQFPERLGFLPVVVA